MKKFIFIAIAVLALAIPTMSFAGMHDGEGMTYGDGESGKPKIGTTCTKEGAIAICVDLLGREGLCVCIRSTSGKLIWGREKCGVVPVWGVEGWAR